MSGRYAETAIAVHALQERSAVFTMMARIEYVDLTADVNHTSRSRNSAAFERAACVPEDMNHRGISIFDAQTQLHPTPVSNQTCCGLESHRLRHI